MADDRTYWFVEPLNTDTNGAIADLLNRMGTPPEQAECKVAVDGYARLVYEAPYSVVRVLQNSHEHDGKFRVYVREGRYGKVRLWPFKRWPHAKKTVVRKGV